MGGKHFKKTCEKSSGKKQCEIKQREKTREKHREKQRGVMRD